MPDTEVPMHRTGCICAVACLLVSCARNGPRKIVTPRADEGAQRKTTSVPEDLSAEALVERLKSSLPEGWEVVEVETGRVQPPYWPEGHGTSVKLSEKGGWPGKGGIHMQVCFMDRRAYDPPGAQREAALGLAQSGPAAYIAVNSRVRVYLWGGWPRAREEIIEKLGLTLAAFADRAEWTPVPGRGPPFPGVVSQAPDPEIMRSVSVRAVKWNEPEGIEAHKRLLSMGRTALPELIAAFRIAANSDPRILKCQNPETAHDEGDYGNELQCLLCVLVEIGDRRALPAIGALVGYDGKARRMRSAMDRIASRQH